MQSPSATTSTAPRRATTPRAAPRATPAARWTCVPAGRAHQQPPIGGSSFDVDSSGFVDVLDEAHRRVLRFSPDGGAPRAVPVDIRGTIADLAVGTDGGLAVLETVADDHATPLLHSFD